MSGVADVRGSEAADEDRPCGRDEAPVRNHPIAVNDRFWSMFLDGRVGYQDRKERRRLLTAHDAPVAGERRVSDERRRRARVANKAARAARRAGRR